MSSIRSTGPGPAVPSVARAARIFYFAEQLGGVLYRRFADGVDNEDVQHALHGFGSDEYRHADWYLEWLLDRGVEPPRLESVANRVAPVASRLLAPRSLEEQLRLFSNGEATAARHLRGLVGRISDPSLRAIVERTIPAEQGHADWLPGVGHRMLRDSDRTRGTWFSVIRPASPARR